jgi:AraC-like DNA-binding protein
MSLFLTSSKIRYFFPPPDLREYVSHYIILETNLPENKQGILCSYPDGICVMSIFVSADLPDFHLDTGLHENKRGIICGLLNKGIKLKKAGNYKCILAFFTPTGALDLFGIPQAKYCNTLVTLEELLGNEGAAIVDKINESTCNFIIIDQLNAFFREYAKKRFSGNLFCKQISNELYRKNGITKVDDMIKLYRVSGRSLDRTFNNCFGVTPKHYLKLLRLGNSFRLLLSNRFDVQDVIYLLKYYDQSHMIHDFAFYSDITPTDLVKRSEKTFFPIIYCMYKEFVSENKNKLLQYID